MTEDEEDKEEGDDEDEESEDEVFFSKVAAICFSFSVSSFSFSLFPIPNNDINCSSLHGFASLMRESEMEDQ